MLSHKLTRSYIVIFYWSKQSKGDSEYWDKIWDVAQDISTTEIYVCYIM